MIIVLYSDHVTHEPFTARIKTNLDLERLFSGMFATHDLILTLGILLLLPRPIQRRAMHAQQGGNFFHAASAASRSHRPTVQWRR